MYKHVAIHYSYVILYEMQHIYVHWQKHDNTEFQKDISYSRNFCALFSSFEVFFPWTVPFINVILFPKEFLIMKNHPNFNGSQDCMACKCVNLKLPVYFVTFLNRLKALFCIVVVCKDAENQV
jgi:hypothetical protein